MEAKVLNVEDLYVGTDLEGVYNSFNYFKFPSIKESMDAIEEFYENLNATSNPYWEDEEWDSELKIKMDAIDRMIEKEGLYVGNSFEGLFNGYNYFKSLHIKEMMDLEKEILESGIYEEEDI